MRDFVDQLARTPLSKVLMVVAVLTAFRVAVFPKLIKTPPHMRTGTFTLFKFLNEVLDAVIYAGVIVFMLIRPFGVQTFQIPSGSMWPTLGINDFIVANKAIYRYSDPKAGDIVVFRPPVEAAQGREWQIDPVTHEMNVDFIKRCIGTPGMVVELRKGQLYRDGKKVDESYKAYSEVTRRVNGEAVEFRSLTDEEKDNLAKGSFKLVKYKGQIIPLNYTDYDANSTSPRVDPFQSLSAPYSIADRYALSPDEMDQVKALPAEPVPSGYYLMMGDNRNGSFDGRAWGLVPREDIVGRSEFIWLPISRLGVTR